MSNMRNTRDTFLHFLADNLVPVHALRFDKDVPKSNIFQVNSVNVTFHDATYSTHAPSQHFVTLDILHTSELDALDLEEQVVALLQQAGYTPLLDYSSTPTVPVGNTLIYWDATSIKFRTVAAADYFHRSAILQLLLRYA